MAYRAFTGLHSGTTNQVKSISGTVPASCAAGDVLLIVGQQGTGVNTLTVSNSGPTVPTLVSGPQVTLSNDTAYVWALPLAAGDLGATIAITSSGSGYFDGALHAFSGVQTTGLVVNTAAVTTAATSITTPTVDAPVDGCDIVTLWALRAASSTTPVVTVPGTQTKDGAATTGASGASPSFSLTGSHRTTPGAKNTYGGSTGTVNTPATGTVFTIALRPAATGGTDTGFKAYYSHPTTGVLYRCDVYFTDPADPAGTLVKVSSKTS